MKQKFEKNIDLVLSSVAALMLLLIALFFVIGIRAIVRNMEKAIVTPQPATTGDSFNITGGKKILENRGLLQQ